LPPYYVCTTGERSDGEMGFCGCERPSELEGSPDVPDFPELRQQRGWTAISTSNNTQPNHRVATFVGSEISTKTELATLKVSSE